MQFQVQKLVDVKKTEQEQDKLDLFVGLKSPLNDPFNVFLRVSDLEHNNIYFYAYSLGKKKVVLWGIYDRSTNEFLIDQACKYNVNDLKSLLEVWKKQKYSFFFSGVRDRISSRMTQNILYNDRSDKLKLIRLFKKMYMGELINKGIISGTKENIDPVEYSTVLNRASKAGLKALSSPDFNVKQYSPSIDLLLNNLDAEDERIIRNAIYNRSFNNLTPYQTNVVNHILIHIFILIFLDIDEYRIVKYIQHLNSNKNKQLKRYLKGGFMYEWLLELGKMLRVYNLEQFMKDVSEDVLRLIEEKINRSDVGVIGGEAIPINLKETVDDLSRRFESFIEKSEYSKTTFVNNLKMCPSLESCDKPKEGCELFYHGEIESQFDLS